MSLPPIRLAGLALAFTAATPAPAAACSVFFDQNPTPAEKRRDARQLIARATAIVDGEVIRPFIQGKQTALVRARRVLKGPQQLFFEVGERDSCTSPLMAVGERSRYVLFGGPDLYFMPSDWPGEPHYIDRLLRSDRRKVWPWREGRFVTGE